MLALLAGAGCAAGAPNTPAGPEAPPGNGITIIDAQARPMPGKGNPVLVRAVIRNDTSRDDKLVGGSSPVARAIGLYVSIGETPGATDPVTGIPGLAPTPWISIPAGVILAPGFGQMVLMDLSQPLVAGQTVQVTFDFAYANPVTVQIPVVSS